MMTDDPQQTPHPEKPNTITAMVIAKLEAVAEQGARTECAVVEMAKQVSFLTSAITANADQTLRLTLQVEKLTDTTQELVDSLGGMRDGLRRTNSRLRAVAGSVDDGGLDP